MNFLAFMAFPLILLCGCSEGSSTKILGNVDSLLVSNERIYEDSVVAGSIIISNSQALIDLMGDHENTKDELYENLYDNHVITGQKAADEIVGKFDGEHLDTLYIEEVVSPSVDNIDGLYFLSSRSGKLPQIAIYGCKEMKPLIYKEGDLDGNGTDDVGYLHTGTTSQWRYYRILTFRNGEWYNMFGDEEPYLNTSLAFRHSGYEIAKPAKQKGKVCITYKQDGLDSAFKDTIVEASFTINRVSK